MMFDGIFYLAFVAGSFLIFIFAIILLSCDEGSCSLWGCCGMLLWIFSCGGFFGMADCRTKAKTAQQIQ